MSNKGSSGAGWGCTFLILLISIPFGICGVLFTQGLSSDYSIKSTIERTKLDSSLVVESQYYYGDYLEWFSKPDVLVDGLKEFYDKTGVQPLLVVNNNINNSFFPKDEELEQYTVDLYNSIYEDEGHIIVTYIDQGLNNTIYIYCGDDAKTVFDNEALMILESNIRHELDTNSDLTKAEIFGEAFSDTGYQIMTTAIDRSIVWLVTILSVIIIALIIKKLFKWSEQQPTTNNDVLSNVNLSSKISSVPLQENKTQNTVSSINITENKADLKSDEDIVECPGCGAKNKVKKNTVVECEYCGSLLKG